jgi:Outer membrane protein beta-barrel domain
MRKSFLFLICVFISSLSQGQVLISILFGDKLNTDALIFGLHVDYSFNKITSIEPQDALGKLNLSLFFDARIDEHWRAEIEAIAKYTRGGKGIAPYALNDPQLDLQFAEGSVERKISYVGLMTAIQYTIDHSWYIEAGPQLTLRTKAKDIFKVKTEDGELLLDRDIRDEINRWEFSLISGAGYKFGKGSGMALGVRYNWGLSDVQLNTAGYQQNRGFYLLSNIPIGRNKKKKMEGN